MERHAISGHKRPSFGRGRKHTKYWLLNLWHLREPFHLLILYMNTEHSFQANHHFCPKFSTNSMLYVFNSPGLLSSLNNNAPHINTQNGSEMYFNINIYYHQKYTNVLWTSLMFQVLGPVL